MEKSVMQCLHILKIKSNCSFQRWYHQNIHPIMFILLDVDDEIIFPINKNPFVNPIVLFLLQKQNFN